jgi:glycine/D-amino acid oxidase-like deaminating enzyme
MFRANVARRNKRSDWRLLKGQRERNGCGTSRGERMTSASAVESVTEQRDLRTGTPVWAAYAQVALEVEKLVAPLKIDVVIVGAGITGALLAEATTARGLSTVVIDRRPPGHGSTAASTALLQFEIDTPLIRLADEIGFEKASRIWRRSLRAVGDLAHIVRTLQISCDFAARRALYLAGNTLGAAEMETEGRYRRRAGLPSAFFTRAELGGLTKMDREAALISEGSAEVNPVQLTAGLLSRAQSRGGKVFAPAQLAEVVASTGKVAMVTADGVELEAKALVFATGYELADGVPIDGHRRTSTWAFATPPQPHAIWSSAELIWEAAEPYLYIRSTADGRVVVGGEDEDITDEAKRDALLPSKVATLQEKTKALLPWLNVTTDFAWAGTFGESENGLPSIGPVPDMPNCYAVLSYGGNGITFGVIAAQIIASRIGGPPDPDEQLFAFGR